MDKDKEKDSVSTKENVNLIRINDNTFAFYKDSCVYIYHIGDMFGYKLRTNEFVDFTEGMNSQKKRVSK